jgi:hypothetical protein
MNITLDRIDYPLKLVREHDLTYWNTEYVMANMSYGQRDYLFSTFEGAESGIVAPNGIPLKFLAFRGTRLLSKIRIDVGEGEIMKGIGEVFDATFTVQAENETGQIVSAKRKYRFRFDAWDALRYWDLK